MDLCVSVCLFRLTILCFFRKGDMYVTYREALCSLIWCVYFALCIRKGDSPSLFSQSPHPPPLRAKDTAKPSLSSYANVTASRSSRANLVMDLKDIDFGGPKSQPTPAYLTEIFNDALKSSPLHQVHIAATRWTAKGNLVITGGHLTTAQQLRDCTVTLSKALSEDQSVPECDPIPYPLIRPNVKWSKILINGIPTGVLSNRDEAYSPDECHEALVNENPSYATLLVTQKPNWVRPPASYTAGSSSSLVVAFEDPDGNKAKTMLADRHLYAFGARALVKRWKQRPPKFKNKPSHPPPIARTPPPPPSPSAASSWFGATTPQQALAAASFFSPLFPPEVPASERSPQKRKALVISPPDSRAAASAQQPSKRFAFRPPNTRMDEDRP
jgi:hypothetical protein